MLFLGIEIMRTSFVNNDNQLIPNNDDCAIGWVKHKLQLLPSDYSLLVQEQEEYSF